MTLLLSGKPTSRGGRKDKYLEEIPMIRLPILKDELAFLEKLLPDLETRPDLGHLAIEIKKRIGKICQEIRSLERDQNSK
jgi:hypothetical protein